MRDARAGGIVGKRAQHRALISSQPSPIRIHSPLPSLLTAAGFILLHSLASLCLHRCSLNCSLYPAVRTKPYCILQEKMQHSSSSPPRAALKPPFSPGTAARPICLPQAKAVSVSSIPAPTLLTQGARLSFQLHECN